MGGIGQAVIVNANRAITSCIRVDDPLADPIDKDFRLTGRGAADKTQTDPGAVEVKAQRIAGRARENTKPTARPRIAAIRPAGAGFKIRQAVVADRRVVFFMAYDPSWGWRHVKRRCSRRRKGVEHRPVAIRLDLQHVRSCPQTVKREGARLSYRVIQVKEVNGLAINDDLNHAGAAKGQHLIANAVSGEREPHAGAILQIAAAAGRGVVGVTPIGAAPDTLVAAVRFQHRLKGAVRHGGAIPNVDVVEADPVVS